MRFDAERIRRVRRATVGGTLFASQPLRGSKEAAKEALYELTKSRTDWQGKIMRSITSPSSGGDSSTTPMDVRDALSRLGDDRELLSDIIEIYLEDSPTLLEKIRRAVMGNDPRSLQRAAHSLKGLAATLSAEDVAAASRRLEQMGASNCLGDAVAAVAQLESQLNELNAAAKRYIKSPR